MKICPYCAEDVRDEALKCKHCGSWILPPPPGVSAAPTGPNWFSTPRGPKRLLMKSRNNVRFDGVCAGLGDHFGIDPTWVRLVFALTLFLGGIGLIVYCILSVVMPREPELTAAKPPSSAQDLP